LPGPRDGVEREHPFLGERRYELDCEEGISASLFLNELR
jgi:hypothetical protein